MNHDSDGAGGSLECHLFARETEAGTREMEAERQVGQPHPGIRALVVQLPQVGRMVISYACHVEVQACSGEQMMLIC